MPLFLLEFVTRWKASTLSERAGAHSHFNDLCDVLGQPHPAAADQTGDTFTFEKRVSTASGGKGFADVWKRGHFAWEYKGKHKDLHAGFLECSRPRLHEVWSLANCSWHGDGSDGGRPTYNASACFEPFPFPWAPGQEPKGSLQVKAIAAAARELVEKRDACLNPPDATQQELQKRTLTNLYNARPAWLAAAHHKLDEAVFAAYGWPPDISDADILTRLLALNHERAGRDAEGSQP